VLLWLIDRHRASLRSDVAVGSKGVRRCDDGRAASVCCVELRMVLGGLALVLKLGRHRWGARAVHGCEFGGLRPDGDATSAAVVGDAGVVVDDYGAVVDVGDVVYVDAVNGLVVVEAVSVPVAAVIAVAGVSEAVVDASVVADVRAPEAGMEAIAVTVEKPVAGGPKGSVVGSSDPGSGDPVIAGGGVAPVAGGPEVVGRRGGRLVIDGKLGWGLVSFECGLTGVDLSVVGWVVVARIVGGALLVGCGLLGCSGLGSGLGVLFGALLTLVLEVLIQGACWSGLSRSWLLGLSRTGVGTDGGEIRVCRIDTGLSGYHGSASRSMAAGDSDDGCDGCEPDSQT
jgi:hypothetical protein